MSPKSAARLAGVLYLVIIAGGLFAELGVRAQVLVIGDAAATARHILEHEFLFRAGFALWLLARGVNLDRWEPPGSAINYGS